MLYTLSGGPDGADLVRVIRTILEMKIDMHKWKAYGKGMGYLKNNEIMEGIRRHRASLDRALNMVHVRGDHSFLPSLENLTRAHLAARQCFRTTRMEPTLHGCPDK